MDLQHLWADKLVRQYEPLLHKILHQFRISQRHASYDDYRQELMIKLVELGAAFDGNPFAEADQPRYIAMATKALSWRMLDLLRKGARHADSITLDDLAEAACADEAPVAQANSALMIAAFMAQAQAVLSREEYSLLLLFIARDLTMQEMAAHLGVSRQTVHNWRRQIQTKLSPYKTFLENTAN